MVIWACDIEAGSWLEVAVLTLFELCYIDIDGYSRI